ncbi:hypothetical protein DFH28DRAFT_1170725 [Melampsora americana]|nr:hypothetical protein DFH28DRAFT_1170725 [Melampsora americana]
MTVLKARYHGTLGGLLTFYLVFISGHSIGQDLKAFKASSEKSVTDSILPTLGVRGEPKRRLRRSIRLASDFGSRLRKHPSEEITVIQTAVEDLSFGSGVKDPSGLAYDRIGLWTDFEKPPSHQRPIRSKSRPLTLHSSFDSPIMLHNPPWHQSNGNPTSAFSQARKSPTEVTTTKVAPFQPREVGFRLTDYLPVPDWEALGRRFGEATERWNTLNAEVEKDRQALGFVHDDVFGPRVHETYLNKMDERKKEVERIDRARRSARARVSAERHKKAKDRLTKALSKTRSLWTRLKPSRQPPTDSTIIVTRPMSSAVGLVNPTVKMSLWLALFENAMDNLRRNLTTLKEVSPTAGRRVANIV